MHYRKGIVKQIGMVAGGTGITLIYKLIRAICEDLTDSAHVILLYGNKTEPVILLHKKLGEFAVKYPENFEVHYVLSDAPESWKDRKGYVRRS